MKNNDCLFSDIQNFCNAVEYHDLPKRTYENTETDFYGYRNGPEQTSAHTETNFNGNQKR